MFPSSNSHNIFNVRKNANAFCHQTQSSFENKNINDLSLKRVNSQYESNPRNNVTVSNPPEVPVLINRTTRAPSHQNSQLQQTLSNAYSNVNYIHMPRVLTHPMPNVYNKFSLNEPAVEKTDNGRASCLQLPPEKMLVQSQIVQNDNWQQSALIDCRIPSPQHRPSVPNNCPPFGSEMPQFRMCMPPINSANTRLPPVLNNFSQYNNRQHVNDKDTQAVCSNFTAFRGNQLITSEQFSNQTVIRNQNTSVPLVVPRPLFSVPPPNMHNFCVPVLPCFDSMPTVNSQSKENLISEFFKKFSPKEKSGKKSELTVVEYRSALKIGFSLIKTLQLSKCTLTELLHSDDDSWNFEIERISQMRSQLWQICDMLNNSNNFIIMEKKLKLIKRKRVQEKKRKQKALYDKIQKEEEKKQLNQEIDKWLDSIKEKNIKLKREAEMKKEADYILSEVRRKVHEAKRTIEKIKVFEKLRNARQTNAVKKGLFISREHDEKFVKKMFILKETMTKQLADYEAEERALKVMLETEQEGQLEEETEWRIKKMKTIQQKKQRNISECLFGCFEEPSPEEPLFLFYKYHNSANSSIENLIKIRHQWDVYIAEDGEAIPQKWIVPVPPNNPSWEVVKDKPYQKNSIWT